MGLRTYAAALAVLSGWAASPLPASGQQHGAAWVPYAVELLRSDKDGERISDIEWIAGSFPVYIMPVEGGSQPVVRIEAELRHRDWSIFWNNRMVRGSESPNPMLVLEVPLQGEYTPVELFGSRNVVQLEREVVMLHFPMWKRAQTITQSPDERAVSKSRTRLTALIGADLYAQSLVSTGSLAARLHAHTGLGSSGNFRLGMGAWYSVAGVMRSNTNTNALRREIDAFLGYSVGGKVRVSLFAGMTSLTLSSSSANGGATVAGPLVMPSVELPMGRKFALTVMPRVAIYNSLPDAFDSMIEFGAQFHFRFGRPQSGALALVTELRIFDDTSSHALLTLFAGLGYSL